MNYRLKGFILKVPNEINFNIELEYLLQGEILKNEKGIVSSNL